MSKDINSSVKTDKESKKEVKSEVVTKVEPTAVDLSAIQKTIESLQSEIKTLKAEKANISDAEKSAIEEAREFMLTGEDLGPCFLDPKYKMDGFHYRATDLTKANIIERRMKLGYEIARYSDTTDGEKASVSDPKSLTDAITVALGNDMVDRPGVWMRIPLEQYQKRQAMKARLNNQNIEDAIRSGASSADFGDVSIGNQSHFKK